MADPDKDFLKSFDKNLKKLDIEDNQNKKNMIKKEIKIKPKLIIKKNLPPKFKKKKNRKNSEKKIDYKQAPTLQIKLERDIAMDFATKTYQRFDRIVKSIILFGSTVKQTDVSNSDIDIMIIIDDASIRWDEELVVWYREELEKLVKANPYRKSLHVNTIKLTTWWNDLMRGDPVVLNIIRDGESLIDFGGFFEPLKFLLVTGKIRSSPEAIYSLLQRAPQHVIASKFSEMGSIEGLYWAMVDSSQAALIAAGISPASPEHISINLKEQFVDSGKLKMKYVIWYRDLLALHKKIVHREINDLKGVEIDDWREKTEEFLNVMAKLVDDIII